MKTAMRLLTASAPARWLGRRPWLRLALVALLPVLWLVAGLAFLAPLR